MHRSRVVAFFAGLVLLLTHAVTLVGAICPSNGDTRVLYVTANGDRGFNDILMLDMFGRPVGTAINWTSVPLTSNLLKLRGMTMGPDGRLYVAIALGMHSKVVAFKKERGPDCTLQFDGVITHVGPTNPYLQHPYDVRVLNHVPTRGTKGTKESPAFTLFTTNQNSASVSWFNGLDGTLLPSPLSNGTDGLFAVDYGRLHEHENPLSAKDGRHDYSLASVRGAAVTPHGQHILVADVDSDLIRVFDTHKGTHLWNIEVPAPIQIAIAPPGFLNLDGSHPDADREPHALVTTKTSAVYVIRITDPNADSAPTRIVNGHAGAQSRTNVKVFASGFVASSGITYDVQDSTVFISDRVTRRVRRFRFDGAELGQWGPSLLDQPEHLLLVTLADPHSFPHCYEMGPYGLKYSVFCVATRVWLALAVASVGLFIGGYLRPG